jgi:protein-S-isoprenylcysteine O-methyltransferase Ste14
MIKSATTTSPIVVSSAQRDVSPVGRVAAGLWFAMLAFVYGDGLIVIVRAVPAGSVSFGDWAPIVSRLCAMLFFLTMGWLMLTRRRSSARREGLAPVAVALLGTYSVWLIPFLPSGDVYPMLAALSATITLGGSVAILYVISQLGRSFSIAPQARKLVVSGPYRLVRHPLYAAEEIAVVGVLLQCAWYAALPFLIVHLGLQIRRMIYEESLLKAVFPDYAAYARRTARLIPGVW